MKFLDRSTDRLKINPSLTQSVNHDHPLTQSVDYLTKQQSLSSPVLPSTYQCRDQLKKTIELLLGKQSCYRRLFTQNVHSGCVTGRRLFTLKTHFDDVIYKKLCTRNLSVHMTEGRLSLCNVHSVGATDRLSI